ncbi:MAG: hypothetical protein ACREXP_18055 [Steroidobacteraceae bacterium]
MQSEPRIQNDPGLATRYLAGQLSAPELQAYEQHLLDNPDAVIELEATARMKVGLANLRDAGELESLLQAPTPRRSRMPALALAACAALFFIAVGLWRGSDNPHDATLATTGNELVDRSGRPLAIGSRYALLRTRSPASDAVIELPAEPHAIELRVRPDAQAPLYSVALSRIHSDGSVTQIGTVTELNAQADGFVQLYVDSSRLEPGPHLLVIAPSEDRTAAATSSFRVKVIGSATNGR